MCKCGCDSGVHEGEPNFAEDHLQDEHRRHTPAHSED